MKTALLESVQCIAIILIVYTLASIHHVFMGGDFTNSLVTVMVGWFSILVVDVRALKNRNTTNISTTQEKTT